MKFLLSAARSAGAIRKLVFGLALAAGVTDSRADWSGQDIGGVGVSGSSSFVSGTASVSGGGTVFGGTADAFNYLSQPVSGDCEITAKITSLDNIDPSSAAGLVMRSTLDAGAVSVAVYSTSSNGTDFSVRNTTSGTSVVTPGSAQTAPAWLRLVKTGTTVAGYVSTDGLSWSLVSQSTVSFSSTYYVGMAVASNAPGTLATGLFTRVTLATNLPASVGGLSLWLRADGGVVMGASGSSVSQWNDHSVFGNNAVQITGTSQPTWIDSQLVGPSNSQPILRFDGTNDFLSIPDAGSLKPSQFTVFLVGKKQSAGSVNGVFFVKSSTTTAWADGYGLSKVNVSLPSTTGVAVFANNYGSKVSGILPSDTYAVLAGRYDGSQVTMSVTSTMTVVTTGTYLAGITNSTAPLLIGASGTNALQGDIAEMLLFNRALSDSEQQDIQAYLYSKYAIGAQPLLPTLTVAGSAPHGIYTSVPTQPVALGPLGAGVTVYYTTDGSDPTITSSVYDPSHPPVQTGSQMLKFKAFKTGYAPSPTFVPASYAIDSSANFTRMGLALWLRSDVGLATHLTTSGTIVTTKVDQWSDMSGGENDAFPVSSSNLPSLVSGTFGSFSGPLVATSSNFSSPGSCLSISDNPTLDLSQMTIIAVAASGGSGNSIVAKGSALSSSGYGLVTGTGAVLPADIVSGFWVNGLNAGWVKSGTSFHVLEGTFDGNVARFYIDNSLSGTAINSSPVAQNTEPLFVGGPLGSASNGGSIAEILIFNRVLSESELTGVEEYLLSRYNLGALHLSSGSPESGSYTTAQTVQVDIPSGAQVYYTTDGSEPTTGSTLYSGPITVSAPTILKFKGFKGSYPPGPTLTESYLIDSTATFNKAGLIVWMRSDLVAGGGSTWPDLSGQNNNAVATGDPHFPIAVHPPSLSSALIGSGTRPVLHFSVTGTLTNGFPSQASTDCLAIPDNASLKPSTMTMVVVGQLSGTTQSGVFLAKRDLGAATGYSIARLNTGTVGATINNSATVQAKSPLSPNTFSVMEGRYDQANSRLEFYQNGTLSQFYSTSAAVSYDAGPLYLGATGTTAGLDGDMAEVMVFDHALSVTDRQDVDAYLYFRYGLGVQPTAKTPQLTAGSSLGGSYTGSQTVQIDVPAGTQVYYTTDGSEPTMGSILYSGPITISSSTVLKFKAFNSPNYLPSATVTASYLIDPIATFNKTGLVAWMRADMVQTGSSGGASVSVWPDLSGKGNDAVQNSGTNQPTVISGTVVGSGTVPVLHFDGTNDFLAAPDAPSLRPTTMTMVVIGQQTGGGTSGIFAAKKISAAATGYSIARLGTGTDVGVVLNGSATIRAKGTLNVNTFSSMMGRYDQSASRLEFYQNGTLSQTSTTAVAISYDAGPLYIGATGTTAALQGDLAEVLLYDHALSTADRQDLEAYIYFRYGFGSQPTVIAPTLSGSTPSGGILSSNQSVSINVPLGSMVYYTTDGSGPTQGGGLLNLIRSE